jgi:hypothetical protein
MNPKGTKGRIRDLISHSADLLALAEEGLQRLRKMPDDRLTVLSTFVLVNSIRDWVKTERGLPSYWPQVPYLEAVREVANGTKHLELSPRSHSDPHVQGLSPWDDIDTIDWDELGNPVPMITLCVRRAKDEPLRWRSARWVLEEALDGWRAELRLPPAGHARDH